MVERRAEDVGGERREGSGQVGWGDPLCRHLQGDRQAYTDNLDQAGQWIRQHFNTSKRPVEWVLNEIASLAKINPSPTLPDISGSFHSLQQLIDGKNQ